MNNELNWTVEMLPVLIKGKPTAYYNIVRNDTGHVLGNCTGKYELKQNADFVDESLMHAKLNGFDVKSFDSGMVDKEGKQVYVKMYTGKSFQIGPDTVEEAVTIVHHHDGRAISNQSLCTYSINSGISFNLTMMHSKKLSDAACLKCSVEILNTMRIMSLKKIDGDIINSLVNQLINPGNAAMSSRKATLKDKLERAIKDMMPQTLWDILKGVINYSDSVKTSKDRKASMYIGSSAKMVEEAFSILSSHIK